MPDFVKIGVVFDRLQTTIKNYDEFFICDFSICGISSFAAYRESRTA
ncbi:MAG: hypothetical protein ACR2N3_15220 [Pyrinomonadaceae bacterium]